MDRWMLGLRSTYLTGYQLGIYAILRSDPSAMALSFAMFTPQPGQSRGTQGLADKLADGLADGFRACESAGEKPIELQRSVEL
jgi:hypothetical protein